LICSALIGRASNAITLHKTPPLEQAEQFSYLLERYFAFSLPAIDNPKSLAKELAKRTRFLRDEIIAIELAEEERQGKKVLLGFYDSFKRLLINKLTHEQFADLYAQTLTYGIFAARTKSEGDFNRELIYKYIPNTLGVLKSIFKFISYDEPPKALEVLIDDIAEILCVTDIKKILHVYYKEGKGSDPIIHFYETFLSEYDPTLREKRGVYYTPEPVVRYIVKSIHSILKSHFSLKDGLADSAVTLLDPAAGTLTFPAEAIKLAVHEYTGKYGSGSIKQMIKHHIIPHFYALELMMAPYTVGHLKISYLLDELGYQMAEDERFKLYLSNTLEKDLPAQIETPFTHEITEECLLANKVKQDEPVLVILGNPPYSVNSENTNEWTEQLLKQDLDGATSYYKVDGMPLGEANSKMLQDDYVKFIRFAQWKIQKAGKGIVGMVTNHSYIGKIEAQQVNVVLSPGSGTQNNTIIIKNTKNGSTGSVPIAGTISTNNEMRGYIRYLIDRFNELAAKGDRKGRVFKPAVIYSNINKEFGSKWDYISESRFPDLVDYLQKKISGTEMGRKLRQKSGDMFHSFEEHLKIMR